jgi:hypothetical protein
MTLMEIILLLLVMLLLVMLLVCLHQLGRHESIEKARDMAKALCEVFRQGREDCMTLQYEADPELTDHAPEECFDTRDWATLDRLKAAAKGDPADARPLNHLIGMIVRNAGELDDE